MFIDKITLNEYSILYASSAIIIIQSGEQVKKKIKNATFEIHKNEKEYQ